LIRHGEKDDYHIPLLKVQQNSSSTSSSTTTTDSRKRKRSIIKTMYELNQKGWDRADHLKDLVALNQLWPKFHGLYATRPPSSNQQIWNVYPNFVRDDIGGQSLVKREYQTLVPISKYLNISINTNYTKSEIHPVAFDITKSATTATTVPPHFTNGHNGRGDKKKKNIILVSWDHCSLPTLIVNGFGCTDNNQLCFRCWSDQRFGDVLKLNVSLTTTTTTVTTNSDSNSSNIDIIISNDAVDVKYVVSSTIISMTGEGYKPSIIDQYYYKNNRNGNSSSSIGSANVNVVDKPVSIEKSTPCLQSYCTARPVAATLVNCLCYNNNSNNNIGNNINGNGNGNGNGNNSNTNTNTNTNSNSNSNNNWSTLPPYNNNNKNRN
jgi:hypothetical protein